MRHFSQRPETPMYSTFLHDRRNILIFYFQVVVRPMMYIALTYDHRLIDGREAVFFLRKIKAAVEDPRIIIAGL